VARLKLFREPKARSRSPAVADPERTEQRLREMLRELEAIKRHENRARRARQRTIQALVNMRLGIAPKPKRVPGVPRVGFRTPSFETIKLEGLPRWLWWRPEPPAKQAWRRSAEAKQGAPAPPCKSTNQTQSPDGRPEAVPLGPAIPPALQIDRTNPLGPESRGTLGLTPSPRREEGCGEGGRIAELGTPSPSSLRSPPSPTRGEGKQAKQRSRSAAPRRGKGKQAKRQAKPTTPARHSPRIEENPARIPTDGPTEPPAPPPGTPEWDEYYRKSMGQPMGRRTEWWPNGPARTDREVEEQRLREVGGYTDIEIRIHRALNRKPSWLRDPSDLESRIQRALNRKPSWIRGPPRRR
jgi:hypothetical protein